MIDLIIYLLGNDKQRFFFLINKTSYCLSKLETLKSLSKNLQIEIKINSTSNPIVISEIQDPVSKITLIQKNSSFYLVSNLPLLDYVYGYVDYTQLCTFCAKFLINLQINFLLSKIQS